MEAYNRESNPERIAYKKQWMLDNKERLKIKGKRWYKKNKSLVIERTQARRKVMVEWLDNYKSTLKCSECPENHVACLDFHHIDPSEKDLDIGKACRNGWGVEKLKKEIAKCKVLCSNCHRKLHWTEKQLEKK